MCECSCNSQLNEETDPALEQYKKVLKDLGDSVKSAHKSTEGKKLSIEYWKDVVKLLKKAKLGISMMELGIDDEEELETDHDATTKKVKSKSDGEADSEESESSSDENEDDDTSKKLSELGLKNEEAKSKSQQRLFGMVHALNNGELKKSDVSDDLYQKIKKISDGMTKKDAKKMAKTNHDDLPEKVPSNEHYDILNHLSILLTESGCRVEESDGAEFKIDNNSRIHTIKFDDKFYLVSESYNFELGTSNDIQNVVDTFVKLTSNSEDSLKHEYNTSLN
tara:strand:- start:72 stop:908 length:837 start_codon:yes stop_codon:yes gene_type:complete